MSSNTTRYLEIMGKLVSLLHELANDLEKSCTSLVEMNLNRIYQHTARQEYLAATIFTLDQERHTWERRFPEVRRLGEESLLRDGMSEEFGLEDRRLYRAVLDEWAASRQFVMVWSAVHSALLNRSRQTVEALINGVSTLQLSYPMLGPDSELGPLVSSRM